MRVGMVPSATVKFASSGKKEDLEGFPSKQEKKAADKWLKQNKLNQYGDPEGAVYAGDNPLFYSGLTRYQYLVQQYPDKPWIKKP